MYIDLIFNNDLSYELRRAVADEFDLHYSQLKGGDNFVKKSFPVCLNYCAAATGIGLCRYLKRFEN